MLLSLCRCQLRHINHAFINIATCIIGVRRWHGIWRIRWSPTGYWRSLQLMRCVMWRAGWLLANRGHLRWINYLIIQLRRHRYHRWWKLIYLWVTSLAIKSPVITRSVLWRAGWLLTNRGQLRWIDDWIIQCRRNIYHRWWQLVALWVAFLPIGEPVIMRNHSLPTLIFWQFQKIRAQKRAAPQPLFPSPRTLTIPHHRLASPKTSGCPEETPD